MSEATWTDILGNELSAADTLSHYYHTRRVGESLATWLERQSVDLWGAEHRPADWQRLAAELRADAKSEAG